MKETPSPADVRFSMVASASGRDPKPVPLALFARGISDGRWREPVEAVRAAYGDVLASTGSAADAKKAAGPLKKALPAAMFSGCFTGRGDNKLEQYSHLLCADLDDLDDQQQASASEKFRADPHVVLAFLSPTGTGLKVVFAVAGDAQQHLQNFQAVKAHVSGGYGLAVDEACKNLERLCFVSYDPAAHFNPAAVPLAPLEQSVQKHSVPSAPCSASGRCQIAEGLLGFVTWESQHRGFARCPGSYLHTSPDGARDCEVLLDGAPTIHCLHQHCAGVVAGVNHELRSRVGKAESANFNGFARRGLASEYLGSKDVGEELEDEPSFTAPAWPAPLAAAAYHGLAGDVIHVIEPHTEADPAALLVMLLVAIGNMFGANTYFLAEARRHYPRLFAVLVGETAKGRKGSAWSNVSYFLEKLDGGWFKDCTGSGLSSGEGLIHAVRDPVVKHSKLPTGEVREIILDDGVGDKRLLVVEEEFSTVLKVAAREGNTLSDMLRCAWDSGNLKSLTRNSPASATGAHISCIGHITKADLSRLLAENDALNGFGNRFLWLAVRRSKLLPEGGSLHTENLAPLILRLRQALDFAQVPRAVERSREARLLWRDVYPSLSRDRAGLLGAITNRAEAETMRMALTYALLDCSPEIEAVHLQAALAVWAFCERSASFIFGEALGDKVADRILDELRCAGSRGLTRNEIREIFKRNLSQTKAASALAMLQRLGLAGWAKETRQGAGRPAIIWRATRARQAVTEGSPAPPSAVLSGDRLPEGSSHETVPVLPTSEPVEEGISV